ncbi:MAG: hypothetical protein NC078_03560 [Ruminococcus sp.]|nr:hypothetical protein [Ruminococcus sp.]
MPGQNEYYGNNGYRSPRQPINGGYYSQNPQNGRQGQPFVRRPNTFPDSRPRNNGYINGGYSPENQSGHFQSQSPSQNPQSYGNPQGNFRNTQGNQNRTPFVRNSVSQQPPPPREEPAAAPLEDVSPNSEKAGGLLSLLDGIKLDPEKATLVLLIVILSRNGADVTLIMALAYLLM